MSVSVSVSVKCEVGIVKGSCFLKAMTIRGCGCWIRERLRLDRLGSKEGGLVQLHDFVLCSMYPHGDIDNEMDADGCTTGRPTDTLSVPYSSPIRCALSPYPLFLVGRERVKVAYVYSFLHSSQDAVALVEPAEGCHLGAIVCLAVDCSECDIVVRQWWLCTKARQYRVTLQH